MNRELFVTSDTQIEEVMDRYPKAVAYFIEKGVSPISCSGAFPKSLGEFLKIKKVEDIENFVNGLNDFIGK